MVRRTVWQKGFMLVILIAAATFFYTLSAVKETARQFDGSLVFTNQYSPLIERESISPVIDEKIEGDVATVDAQASQSEEVEGLAAPAMAQIAQRLPMFDQFRVSRLQERARRIETIESLLQSEVADAERRARLQDELLSLASLYELEEQVEGLLIARGLADAVVVIGPTSAEVIVPERITRDQAGQIGNVVARIAGISLSQITIVDGAHGQ